MTCRHDELPRRIPYMDDGSELLEALKVAHCCPAPFMRSQNG